MKINYIIDKYNIILNRDELNRILSTFNKIKGNIEAIKSIIEDECFDKESNDLVDSLWWGLPDVYKLLDKTISDIKGGENND